MSTLNRLLAASVLTGMGLRAGRLVAWLAPMLVAIAALGVLHGGCRVADAAGIPVLAAMFVVIARHARRKQSADRQRQLLDEQNARLLDAQRRFLQDAPHHLGAPLTDALNHAELLAKDLSGRELQDIQTVAGEIIRLREHLLVIAAAEESVTTAAEPDGPARRQ
jgi:signal transduction histidine kinase